MLRGVVPLNPKECCGGKAGAVGASGAQFHGVALHILMEIEATFATSEGTDACETRAKYWVLAAIAEHRTRVFLFWLSLQQ